MVRHLNKIVKGKLVINRKEADLVETIFGLYLGLPE